MYSVIIQTQETYRSFAMYRSLFTEAIEESRIGICRWNPMGEDIQTALPELPELLNDKGQWRAVIVRTEDESAQKGYESDRQNPYDFFACREKVPEQTESPIPLIRLTHMLGGPPVPEISFIQETAVKNNETVTVYRSVIDSEQKQKHRELTERYEKHRAGTTAPSSILIITVRRDFDSVKTEVPKSIKRGDFWRVNQYPSICRFLVHDMQTSTPLKQEAQSFNLWLSVLLLALNDPDSGTLCAYRLHRMEAVIDTEEMQETLQNALYRLKSCRTGLEASMQPQAEALPLEPSLPSFRKSFSIGAMMPEEAAKTPAWRMFRLLSMGAHREGKAWENYKKDSEAYLEKRIRLLERALDQSAQKAKPVATFREHEVEKLDRFRTEDLARETLQLYYDIIDVQGRLPERRIEENEEMEKAADRVESYLNKRVEKSGAMALLGVAAVLWAISMSVAFLAYEKALFSIELLLAATGIGIGVMALCAWITLIGQKLTLDGLVKKYNAFIARALGSIKTQTADYSEYLSKVISHSRGRSYLLLSERKKQKEKQQEKIKRQHMAAMERYAEKLMRWGYACGIELEREEQTSEDIVSDALAQYTDKKLYTLEYGAVYETEVNHSGMMFEAPVAFVKSMIIEREELDDGGHHDHW